ncbi:MAG: membrane protein insertion efficiency factor YidD [Bacteroidota bacterium]|jgi:putative membrane protein insertion efficiency factor
MWFTKLSSSLLVGLIRLYQGILSPYLGRSCRYSPTCSQYTLEAIQLWGPIKGLWMGLKRISRCHPWGNHGYDPVPKPKLKEQKRSSSQN